MKPTCWRCRLFIVARDGQVCEVCRQRIGKERVTKYQRDLWARRRAAK